MNEDVWPRGVVDAGVGSTGEAVAVVVRDTAGIHGVHDILVEQFEFHVALFGRVASIRSFPQRNTILSKVFRGQPVVHHHRPAGRALDGSGADMQPMLLKVT